ncbi:MAG: SemiSWEET transporter [Chitinispirillaceae bacterium]|nr:SemiSWEET transporter [Chitinispirillaceae bacterium]
MTIDLARMIGLVAGLLTTASLLPQLVKTIRTRSAKDLSLIMLFMFWAGIICWLTYGIMVKEWPVIFANSITLVMASLLLACKRKFR